MSVPASEKVVKLKTEIPGFDLIAEGGLPRGRISLVAGTSGSAKTVFAIQFVVEGILKAGEGGVVVTFEETPDDIRRNMLSLGWDLAGLENDGKLLFIDASPQADEESVTSGSYDLGALMARIENAVHRVGATRVAIDSISGLFVQFADAARIRHELLRICTALKDIGVTTLLTTERTNEYGDIARHGVEEFVADNVVILRNMLEDEKRRRTLEILKFRGAPHQKGEYPFTITSGQGIVVIPLSSMELKQHSSNVRITSGIKQLDEMCGGGFFRDSVILVSGATGTGKTLMTTEFIAGGVESGDKCLLLAFEESREQLFRNATGWGVDFEKFERDGLLQVHCVYPEVMGLEDHIVHMKKLIDDFQPARVAVDSLSALERVSTEKGFREFVIALTSFIKHKETTGLFTSTTPSLMGGASVTEGHISTITDSIILLRYVEMHGEMRRGLTVLKMRGSGHDKNIREFSIDSRGMHIGNPFRDISGILSGHPTHVTPGEVDRMGELFKEDKP